MPTYIRRNGGWYDTLTGELAGTVTPPSATAVTFVTANAVTSNPRDSLVIGVDQPNASNTGVRPGQTLTITTTHNPVSGGRYSNLDIRNTVVALNVGDVQYNDCIFRGANTRPAGATGLLTMHRPHLRDFVLTDCTFLPQLPDYRWMGVQGYGFTLKRCDISHMADAVEAFIVPTSGQPSTSGPIDVTIEQCFFHDHAFFRPGVPTSHIQWGGGETSADGSHCDGVQWQGATGLVARGNYMTGLLAPEYVPNWVGSNQGNANFMIHPNQGNISGANITKNWFQAAAVTFQTTDQNGRYITNLGTVKDNIFLDGQIYPPIDILIKEDPVGNPGGMVCDFGVGTPQANRHLNGSPAIYSYQST